MDKLSVKAYAKINLALDILGKRPDGYHEVRMVMQSIGVCDDIELTARPEPGIAIRSNLAFLENPEGNLAAKAWELMREAAGLKGGMEIVIRKNIPVEAGCAGGSADAAAVLRAVNEMYALGMGTEQLCVLGKRLGADVPFCVVGGTALAEGIGERLTPLQSSMDRILVVAKPYIGVSTKEAYAATDSIKEPVHPDVDRVAAALAADDLKELAANMGNAFEQAVIPLHPEIGRIKEQMLSRGALGAMMTGSGPTVFGLFEDNASAESAAEYVRSKGDAQQVFVTHMIGQY
ncbi:MAG: 4-(cytidine 5'-diphospho)-2-C-methyl-D-erythritol kinase [Oscillospiraceae bacterium]|nr:4-(cytidine 5'-diphospho)-2-C-methyl-D-erythritol kinase [Oscillospiraceae bacterium]